jgi:type I restriction enzyme S subunit
LTQQHAIADVLRALDDKIEQNRRTSQALEWLVRAIFRAWFVDFEPVRAKATGATEFPSMPQHIFDTLPDSFVASELGTIPNGWRVETLGDQCEINQRTIRKDEAEGEIEYIDISSVTVGHLEAVQRVPFADAPSRARRRVRHGDTIWSCVRPNHRSYLFIHTPPSNRIVSTGFAVLSPGRFSPSYLHELTIQQEFVDYLVANADGSAYPAVRPEHFAIAKVIVPPNDVIEAFEKMTMPFRDLIDLAERETSKLATMRDLLLPRLLSGEVRVEVRHG